MGNSGSLTRTKYGRAIDAHDVVARMNQGPTKNYEALVGARTTHRMLNNVYSIRCVPGPVADCRRCGT